MEADRKDGYKNGQLNKYAINKYQSVILPE